MRSIINLIIIFLSLILFSCTQSAETDLRNEFENLPIKDIKLISEFDQSGDYFFQYLNHSTETLPNGNVIISDGLGKFIIQVNQQGDFINLVASNGNGPGEVQDPHSSQMVSDSTILIVDDKRRRIIKKTLNSSDVDEFDLPGDERSRVNEAYATSDPDIIAVKWIDFSALSWPDTDPVTKFSSYNLFTEEFVNSVEYPGKTYAKLRSESGQPRMATAVPHTPEILYDYSDDNTELFVFWPEDSQIAVLDPIQLDTLRTIPVNLISEPLSDTERDYLEEDSNQRMWEYVEKLLPEIKSPAENILLDHKNRIWIELTLQSSHQEWIVLNQKGSPEFRVQFPKKGEVTHISEHHIGLRLDDHLFSLYQFR